MGIQDFNRTAGSHFNTIKDSYRIYKEILKFSASSFLGFLVDYGIYGISGAFCRSYGNEPFSGKNNHRMSVLCSKLAGTA